MPVVPAHIAIVGTLTVGFALTVKAIPTVTLTPLTLCAGEAVNCKPKAVQWILIRGAVQMQDSVPPRKK